MKLWRLFGNPGRLQKTAHRIHSRRNPHKSNLLHKLLSSVALAHSLNYSMTEGPISFFTTDPGRSLGAP